MSLRITNKTLSSAPFNIALYGGIVVFYLLSFLFAEKIPAAKGLGWDGARYASLAADLWDSKELDNYLIMRILPSAWIHIVFNAFGILFTPANIIRAFETINLTCILGGVYLTKRVLEHFAIQPMLQVVSLILLLVNYSLLKFATYYPVMTDLPGFVLGAAALYFYVKKEMVNLCLVGLISLFTWPATGVTVIILLVFFNSEGAEEGTKQIKLAQYIPIIGAALYIAVVSYILIYVMHNNTNDIKYTLLVDYSIVPISIAALIATVIWWASWLKFIPSLSVKFWMRAVSIYGIVALLMLLGVFLYLKNIRELKIAEYVHQFNIVRIHTIFGLVRPFISYVSHVNFFGGVFVLLLLFNRSVQQGISNLGAGFAFALVATLVGFGVKSESRVLYNLLPWLVVLLAISINKYNFKWWMFAPIILFNIISSKVWLTIGDVNKSELSADGTVDFPYQYFFMNLGPWMSSDMYRLFSYILLAIITINIFVFYKIKINNGRINIAPRYTL